VQAWLRGCVLRLALLPCACPAATALDAHLAHHPPRAPHTARTQFFCSHAPAPARPPRRAWCQTLRKPRTAARPGCPPGCAARSPSQTAAHCPACAGRCGGVIPRRRGFVSAAWGCRCALPWSCAAPQPATSTPQPRTQTQRSQTPSQTHLQLFQLLHELGAEHVHARGKLLACGACGACVVAGAGACVDGVVRGAWPRPAHAAAHTQQCLRATRAWSTAPERTNLNERGAEFDEPLAQPHCWKGGGDVWDGQTAAAPVSGGRCGVLPLACVAGAQPLMLPAARSLPAQCPQHKRTRTTHTTCVVTPASSCLRADTAAGVMPPAFLG
jgi:hypothetical protein